MSKIMFIPDLEEGHIFPSFGLVDSLLDNGHTIKYVGSFDVIKYARSRGYDCEVIFNEEYPEGYNKWLRNSIARGVEVKRKHLIPLLKGSLDNLVKDIQPDVIVVSYFLPIEALILRYRYPNIPLVIFQTYFRDSEKNPYRQVIDSILDISGDEPEFMMELFQAVKDMNIHFESLEKLAEPLKDCIELFNCPQEFDALNEDRGANFFHMGPHIRRSEPIELSKEQIPDNGEIIYLSMGSQVNVYQNKCLNVFKTFISVMKEEQLQHYHLVVAIGRDLSVKNFVDVPDNVTLMNWVPQLELLKRSKLAIIHGGLGTVKECVQSLVPMMVIPMGRDQFQNAKRISLLKLGYALEYENLNRDKALQLITDSLNNQVFQTEIMKLKNVFDQKDKEHVAHQVISSLVSQTVF